MPAESLRLRPVRIQLSRKAGFRLQETSRAINGLACVKVDRSTPHGNRFVVGPDRSAADSVEMFRHDLDKFETFHPKQFEAWIAPLRGNNIGCWCALDAECHGDVLLEKANPAEELIDAEG